MYCSATSLLRCTASLRSKFSVSTSKRCLQRTRRICSANKDLPAPDVQKLAQLAHISVTEQQVRMLGCSSAANSRTVLSLLYICGAGARLGAQASKHSTMVYLSPLHLIVQHGMQPVESVCLCRFSQLQQADVTGIEPAVRADVQADNVLRDDVPQECESRSVAAFNWAMRLLHKLKTLSNSCCCLQGRPNGPGPR